MDETNIFHNKSGLLILAQKTTHIGLFITVSKGVWENTSKEKPQMAGKEQNHIPEWTHMCKSSHAQRQIFLGEGTCSLNTSCEAVSYGGGAPTIPQRLQNSQNVWNSEVSHIFHLPKQIRGRLVCKLVKVRSPLLFFDGGNIKAHFVLIKHMLFILKMIN